MNRKLKIALITSCVGIAVFSTGILVNNNSSFADGTSIAQDAANGLTNQNIEFIKIIEGNSVTINWRDHKGERHVTEEYLNDKLVKKTILTEGGKQVTVIATDENGKLIGRTWTMPPKIAAENKKIGQLSLLEDVKTDLQTNKWKVTGDAVINQVKVKEISFESEGRKEIVTVDTNTGFPVKRIIQSIRDGEMVTDERTEEYKVANTIDEAIFSTENTEIIEQKAPVANDEVGVG